MARDGHSRRVGLLKVVLPLAALVLLSSLVLFSEERTPVVPATGEGERRVGSPDYAAVTDDGSRISVLARLARPEGEGGLAEVLDARIDGPDRSATVTGATGEIDGARTTLALTGGTLATSEGYAVAAPEIDVALTETLVEGRGAVTGTGPGLRIDAAEMRMDARTLTFTGDVRLVYEPEP